MSRCLKDRAWGAFAALCLLWIVVSLVVSTFLVFAASAHRREAVRLDTAERTIKALELTSATRGEVVEGIKSNIIRIEVSVGRLEEMLDGIRLQVWMGVGALMALQFVFRIRPNWLSPAEFRRGESS